MQLVERHLYHVEIVLGLFEELLYLYHVPRSREGPVPQSQVSLLIYDLQHLVYVRIVDNQKALGIGNCKAVLLKDRDTEAVESVYIARIVVACKIVDTASHLVCSLIGKGHAEDIPGEYAQIVYKIGKAVCERSRLARARSGYHSDISLCGSNRLSLFFIQNTQIGHLSPSFCGRSCALRRWLCALS